MEDNTFHHEHSAAETGGIGCQYQAHEPAGPERLTPPEARAERAGRGCALPLVVTGCLLLVAGMALDIVWNMPLPGTAAESAGVVAAALAYPFRRGRAAAVQYQMKIGG